MGKWFRQILQGEHSLFRLSLPFRVRLFNVLALVGGMISLINGISSYANNQDSVILGLNLGIAVLSFVLLFYAYKSGRYQFCYVVTIIMIFLMMFPYLFFKSGGYKGGMVSFYIFGILFTVFMLEGKVIGANVSVYDKDKKAVATILDTEDQQVFVPNVKKGEVYYLKLADQIKDEFVATICVKKDNVTPLQTNILYTQSGQDKNIYQEFKTDKRSSQSIYLKPSNYSNKNVTFYLQKKEKGVWKTITNRMIAVANDHKRVTFDTGLKKGEYRLVSNAATGQIYQIALQNQPVSNKYQTKKAKAQTIKKGKTVRNIYTTSEKAARWYKVKATKKQSIKISTNNNSGKLEVSIYKKGRKKVLKKLSFKGEQSKTYRVKKGTYYVKTAKSGAKMNGEYTIRCK